MPFDNFLSIQKIIDIQIMTRAAETCKIGRRGSPWASKEDATTWKWSRSNTRKVNERKPEARREGKGPPKRES